MTARYLKICEKSRDFCSILGVLDFSATVIFKNCQHGKNNFYKFFHHENYFLLEEEKFKL